LRLKGRSHGSTWTCSACGADNDEALKVCSSCGGDRAGDLALPRRPESDTFEDKLLLPEPLPEPEDVEEQEKEGEEAEDAVEAGADDEKDEEDEEEAAFLPLPPTVISSPLSSIETPPKPSLEPIFQPASERSFQPVPEPTLQPAPEPTFQPTPEPPSQPMGTGRYYLVFVNTPAQSLIKSKIPIELDIFPVVSIGRSPENVVVIPDQEVSRVHAELTAKGSTLLLKDLKSKNGTYVYDGKKFEQVTDSVEVKPNTILKFGTGTIVRLVSE